MLAWLRQEPQGVFVETWNGPTSQTWWRRWRGGVGEEQEGEEEWEQAYQSAELENPCLLDSTLESWAPWYARNCSMSPWSWCRLRKSANMLS